GENRLVLCDSRNSAEQLSSMLRTHSIRTFVSHASLSLSERRQAEAAFSEERDCVIVATSTLELGIDVGDLDRVIQIDSPSSVSSFLQRMGRTGRRTGSRRNCLFLTTNDSPSLLALGVTPKWATSTRPSWAASATSYFCCWPVEAGASPTWTGRSRSCGWSLRLEEGKRAGWAVRAVWGAMFARGSARY